MVSFGLLRNELKFSSKNVNKNKTADMMNLKTKIDPIKTTKML